jgi:hypothetical protein
MNTWLPGVSSNPTIFPTPLTNRASKNFPSQWNMQQLLQFLPSVLRKFHEMLFSFPAVIDLAFVLKSNPLLFASNIRSALLVRFRYDSLSYNTSTYYGTGSFIIESTLFVDRFSSFWIVSSWCLVRNTVRSQYTILCFLLDLWLIWEYSVK